MNYAEARAQTALVTAYYSSPIADVVDQASEAILGHLAKRNPFALDALQRNAWLGQIDIVRRQLRGLNGWIAFEFAIPRMGKRADVVLVTAGVVFVIEFKVGSRQFDAAAFDQVMDYALDLKNFHAGSHDRRIVPIVVATMADESPFKLTWGLDGVAGPIGSNGNNLGKFVAEVVRQTPGQGGLDGEQWSRTGYRPTPTIIEAAQALYQGHRVENITRSDAGAKNLSETAACLAGIIEDAKAHQYKSICFVTGVPGAGKTLAGLNLVTLRTKAHEEEHAVFLSGNGPLVEVLREALARDEYGRLKERGQKTKKADAARKVNSFVQNIMHFRDGNLTTTEPPIERVAVFDEAQRAWDKNHLAKFMGQKRGQSDFQMSEPEFLVSVMDRHDGWCVIICLVGGGQEINAGEAGLTEWFSALKRSFRGWKVYTSTKLAHRDYHWGQDLAAELEGLDRQSLSALHLAVSVRSFRAEKLSEFVGALVAGEADEAEQIYQAIKASFPIAVTRSLVQAKQWLRNRARGSERIGLVASSGASRLKPEGINVQG
ncbi:DNA/RNA helicase domain-containing protein, partial [Bradyrhizobium sp. Leo170]|uniref:DNA/RNA helicase domain-containing protein n=1 Tax=Bradyrhizobium sp. Leo170 TaxID=1571199 RepID=UPI00102E68A6